VGRGESSSKAQTIFKCNFKQSGSSPSCDVKFQGKEWLLTSVNDGLGNELERYYAVDLKANEKSEMFFADMVPRPHEGVACLSFRYKKYLKGN
jgi:hypothetical protein